MAEQRMFKNPSSIINTFDPEHTWLVEGFHLPGNTFTHQEWDMEVVFTKKLPQFPNGVVVRSIEYPGPCVVVAQHGPWVFVYPEGDPDDYEVFHASETYKVQDSTNS